jgi:TRAP-type mannitol/chloroaromatic compound transport system substrate-binding protein
MSAERLAKRITDLTDGELTVRVYAAGELVGAFEAFDAVSSGTADMAHHADYYLQGKSRAFPFFTSVPFGMTADELSTWIYFDGGQELWDDLYRRFNAKPLLTCSTGTQVGGWYRNEIRTLEDFKGLRIRMPGIGGEVMRRLGAAVVAISGGEIFSALQQGSIDAAEWVGPWNDLAFGLHRVAKRYYYPGFHEPGAGLALAINLGVWESLTPRQRMLLEDITGHEYIYSWSEFKIRNAESQQVLTDKHQVEAKPFPEEVLREMARKSMEVMAEIAASDPFTKRVHDSYMTAMRKYITYQETAEHAFIDARRLWLDLQT